MLSRDPRRYSSLRRSYSRTGWNCIFSSSNISQLSRVLSACWLLLIAAVWRIACNFPHISIEVSIHCAHEDHQTNFSDKKSMRDFSPLYKSVLVVASSFAQSLNQRATASTLNCELFICNIQKYSRYLKSKVIVSSYGSTDSDFSFYITLKGCVDVMNNIIFYYLF